MSAERQRKEREPQQKKLVGIVAGSQLDREMMVDAETILQEFGIGYGVDIISPFLNIDEMVSYAVGAEGRGLKAIIAGTSEVAHLLGMIKALTIVPVIGVPITRGELGGIDALMSMLQMPKGVPINVMAFNNAANAAFSAIEILATSDQTLASRLLDYRQRIHNEVIKHNDPSV